MENKGNLNKQEINLQEEYNRLSENIKGLAEFLQMPLGDNLEEVDEKKLTQLLIDWKNERAKRAIYCL